MKIGPVSHVKDAGNTLQYEPEDLAVLPLLPPEYEWCVLQQEPAIRYAKGTKELIMWMTPDIRTELVTSCGLYVRHDVLRDANYPCRTKHESRDAVCDYMALLCWLGEVT